MERDRVMKNKSEQTPLKEVAGLFFKLGSIAFGGPAAHIAMMEKEVVEKRKWMDHQHFLDLIGATNLIPGPNSSEMAMHCGHERAGWRGLITAGITFIVPAVAITMVFAWLYAKYGTLPAAESYFYGIKPAVVGIILYALYGLGKKAFKNNMLIVMGLVTLGVTFLGVGEITALFACGFAGILIFFISKLFSKNRSVNQNIKENSHVKSKAKEAEAEAEAQKQTEEYKEEKLKIKDNPKGKKLLSIIPLALITAVTGATTLSVLKIFLIFLKVGTLLYGSGYVLFAFLDSELVMEGLLTREQLMDAVAVGQFTPGPVLSTATFIGWQLYGFWGAIAATVGIFLPSFILVGMLNPLIPKLRKSKIMAAFLDAVNVGSVAVIMAVVIQMGRDAVTDWRSVLILIVSIIVSFGFKKLNSAFIVIGGSLAGWLLLMI
ncbi:MAG: chromate transporter [Bacteroidetes bacterium GWE2_39_28]|nr:MAG: chromate transporter [Bacteroidetes bacterium GWE2_39_28]OFY14365.1 MAG: chromate transporter [Bacteroidetes bacterium GWF2_39_10]OFZ10297.1 MAG: chromate transporter [Bacteroidetes bacterium RIFOXYC2_FULL_39_11]HCT95276.1 chromate transporter [Rikenellaceae bacterium]